MSLESQVAALVSAASKLTSEIAGKMKGIDKKVDEATASVPGAIRDSSSMTFFIDAVSGDDNGSGSPGSPLKTAVEAGKRALSMTSVELQFRGGQSHTIDFRGNCPTIRCRSWDSDILGRPKLYPGVEETVSGAGVAELRARGFHSSAGRQSLVFNDVDIHCDIRRDANETREVSGFYSNFIFGDHGKDIHLNNSDIYLKDFSFTGIHSGYASRLFSMGNGTVFKEGDHKLIGARTSTAPPFIFAVHAVSLDGATAWDELLPTISSTDDSNILSNVEIIPAA